uniref:Uncharacterized protein n=1 Tax=Romanomermis culicivorax TaxID=13658 RepID=A0A915HN27_ROMCU
MAKVLVGVCSDTRCFSVHRWIKLRGITSTWHNCSPAMRMWCKRGINSQSYSVIELLNKYRIHSSTKKAEPYQCLSIVRSICSAFVDWRPLTDRLQKASRSVLKTVCSLPHCPGFRRRYWQPDPLSDYNC